MQYKRNCGKSAAQYKDIVINFAAQSKELVRTKLGGKRKLLDGELTE